MNILLNKIKKFINDDSTMLSKRSGFGSISPLSL